MIVVYNLLISVVLMRIRNKMFMHYKKKYEIVELANNNQYVFNTALANINWVCGMILSSIAMVSMFMCLKYYNMGDFTQPSLILALMIFYFWKFMPFLTKPRIYFHWLDDHIEYNLEDGSSRMNTVFIKFADIKAIVNDNRKFTITLINKKAIILKHKDIELLKGYKNLMDRIESMVIT